MLADRLRPFLRPTLLPQRLHATSLTRQGMLPLALLLVLFHAADVASALPSRWGHTLSLVDRSLLVASGKLDTSGQTYTSASTTSTSLLLPLSEAFSLINADSLVQQLEGGGPPYAWGSAETLGDGTSRVLGFGGDGSPGTAIQTGSDSAWIYSSSDGWAQEESGWASQPMRREGGASCSSFTSRFFQPSPLFHLLTPSSCRPISSGRDVLFHRWIQGRRIGHCHPDHLLVHHRRGLRPPPFYTSRGSPSTHPALPGQRHSPPPRRLLDIFLLRQSSVVGLHSRHNADQRRVGEYRTDGRCSRRSARSSGCHAGFRQWFVPSWRRDGSEWFGGRVGRCVHLEL